MLMENFSDICAEFFAGMLDETDAIPSTNYFISDLELPRQNSSEENMRQQVLHLLWDVGALRPSDWEAIDRWAT